MSNPTVTNPEEWHIYPAGAHHKKTECSPSLHYMVAEYLPELWKAADRLPTAAELVDHHEAKKPSFPQHNTPISPDRVEIRADGVHFLDGGEELRYSQRQVEKIVAEVREGEHDRMLKLQEASAERGKAASMSDERAQRPSAQTALQEAHRCARFMLLQFFDGTDFRVDFQNPNFQGGWKVRKMNGVEMLIIGHGVPRQTFPLCNVKYMSLIPEDY